MSRFRCLLPRPRESLEAAKVFLNSLYGDLTAIDDLCAIAVEFGETRFLDDDRFLRESDSCDIVI